MQSKNPTGVIRRISGMSRRNQVLAMASLAVLSCATARAATTVTWNNAQHDPAQGLPGNWDNNPSNTFWQTTNNSMVTNVAWPSGDVASFGSGPDGSYPVTIDDSSGSVTASGLICNFDGSEVTINGSNSSESLNLVGAASLWAAEGFLKINLPITTTVGVNILGDNEAFVVFSAANTYTAPTNIGIPSTSSLSGLVLEGGSLGNTAIVGTATNNEFTPNLSVNSIGYTAGTTGAGTQGATLDVASLQVQGSLILQQETGFTGSALTLNNSHLDFSNLGEVLGSPLLSVTGPGTASVSGAQDISAVLNSAITTPTTFTLISDPNGGLSGGTYELDSSGDTTIMGTNGIDTYQETLNATDTAVTLSVSDITPIPSVPEPATLSALAIGGMVCLRRRTRAK
jgi:hypothetical protein